MKRIWLGSVMTVFFFLGASPAIAKNCLGIPLAMVFERQGFLQEMIQAPEPFLGLVYADLLEEAGGAKSQAKAQAIRLAIELESSDGVNESDPRREKLKHLRYKAGWFVPKTLRGAELVFQHGVPLSIEFPAPPRFQSFSLPKDAYLQLLENITELSSIRVKGDRKNYLQDANLSGYVVGVLHGYPGVLNHFQNRLAISDPNEDIFPAAIGQHAVAALLEPTDQFALHPEGLEAIRQAARRIRPNGIDPAFDRANRFLSGKSSLEDAAWYWKSSQNRPFVLERIVESVQSSLDGKSESEAEKTLFAFMSHQQNPGHYISLLELFIQSDPPPAMKKGAKRVWEIYKRRAELVEEQGPGAFRPEENDRKP